MPVHCQRASTRAFTLIELLVVIGIIALLVALVAAVGARVVGAGRSALTEGAMQSLTAAYTSLEQATGSKPPPATIEVRNPTNTTEKAYLPIIDGLGGEGGDTEPMNSVGLFILQLENLAPEGRAQIDAIDSSIVRTTSPHAAGTNTAWDEPHRELVTVFDAWQAPIRYVHPTFDGIITRDYPDYRGNDQSFLDFEVTSSSNLFKLPLNDRGGQLEYPLDEIRRNNLATSSEPADSDGGTSSNSQPYFYSPGPDGKVGFGEDAQGNLVDYNKDNVYLIDPTIQRPD